ncbi:MAG: FtsK/SpoIIIE domain-containing protein [Eubacteriales bacterium]|nr:FtsK/SpoIIIE domain-containing protein [Eubacteriales bacterium]
MSGIKTEIKDTEKLESDAVVNAVKDVVGTKPEDIKNIQEDSGELTSVDETFSETGDMIVSIGTTDKNDVITLDLSKAPHMLICGFTGTGKTAFVQTILSDILSKKSPKDVRIIILDSKGVEYSCFSGIEHLLTALIHDKQRALSAMNWLIAEEQRRLQLFANSVSKDIYKYNNKCKTIEAGDEMKLPEIFYVIDDFSMLELDKSEMQTLLGIIQNGRITGIHIILISSVVSRKALPGELIMVIPCRICFRLNSKTESKYIFGKSGAEYLLVPGKIIYSYYGDLYKLRSAYTEYEDIEAAMIKVRSVSQDIDELNSPEGYQLTKRSEDAEAFTEGLSDSYDEFICDAALLTITSQNASIGALQR